MFLKPGPFIFPHHGYIFTTACIIRSWVIKVAAPMRYGYVRDKLRELVRLILAATATVMTSWIYLLGQRQTRSLSRYLQLSIRRRYSMRPKEYIYIQIDINLILQRNKKYICTALLENLKTDFCRKPIVLFITSLKLTYSLSLHITLQNYYKSSGYLRQCVIICYFIFPTASQSHLKRI